MTAIIELPESANSPEVWRRQIAEVCERDKVNAHGDEWILPLCLARESGLLETVCSVVRRHFTITPGNLEAIKAGVRLYCGMGNDDVVQSRWLMEG